MIRLPLMSALAALVTVSACSAPDQRAEDEAYRAPVYRTGSNLPAGRETGEAPKELSAAERKTLEDVQNRHRNPQSPLSK